MAHNEGAADSRASSISDGSNKQVAHTLTACRRCRTRKTRCDANLPGCGPCERSNQHCDYWDTTKNRYMPRSYIVDLQRKVRRLEREIADMSGDGDGDADTLLPVEDLVRGAGLVKIRENAESRFLGPSSGIAMTRLVMELAKALSHTKSIKDIVPEDMARGVRRRFEEEAERPLSKVYPSTSSVAAPGLPSVELTNRLVDSFLGVAQTFYPVLHEPTFRKDVVAVYNGSTDPYQNFTLRIVLALSMHRTDVQWTSLGDSFYLAALKYLEGTIRVRNLGTLQCFALIALYSLATPTRTAAYWVVGLAAKLLQELRMTDEATIGCDANGRPLDALEVDLRRRLFYICVNMELALAHSLGRPSAFSVTYDHRDVKFYSDVDDAHITRAGIATDARPTFKKRMSIHFMKMRWLQLEIRHVLYLKKRPTPVDNRDPWFQQMEEKVENWMIIHPMPDNGDVFPQERSRVEYNTMVVFLFRPSPQVPEPAIYAVKRCFKAAVENIHLQRAQLEADSVDVTWVFAQQLFMAINTVLWTLSYSDLRREHSRVEVTRDLTTALDAIYWTSTRWPGVESAFILYGTLVESCLKAYDGDAGASYGVASPRHRAETTSPRSVVDTPPPLAASPSTINSAARPATDGSSGRMSRPQSIDPDLAPPHTYQSLNPSSAVGPSSGTLNYHGSTPGSGSHLPGISSPQLSHRSFDTSGFFQPLPSPLPYGAVPDSQIFIQPADQQFMPWLNMFEMPMPMEGINLTEQEQLLATLETYGFGTPPGAPSLALPKFDLS